MRAFTISLLFMVAFAEVGVCQPVSGSRVVVHLRDASGRIQAEPVVIPADRIERTVDQIVLAQGREVVALFEPSVVAYLFRVDGLLVPAAGAPGGSALAGGQGNPQVGQLPGAATPHGGPAVIGAPGAVDAAGRFGTPPFAAVGPEGSAEAQIRSLLGSVLVRYLSSRIGGEV